MRRRNRLFTLTLAVTAAVLVSLAGVPRSAALPPCTCEGSYQTASQCGTGANCSAATSNLYNLTFALAQQFCGVGNVCNPTLLIATPCQSSGGQVVTGGRLLHGCCAGSLIR